MRRGAEIAAAMSAHPEEEPYDDGLVHSHGWACERPAASRRAEPAAGAGAGRQPPRPSARAYPTRPAATFTAAARMTTLNRNDTSACTSASWRSSRFETATSEVWKVMPMVKAK